MSRKELKKTKELTAKELVAKAKEFQKEIFELRMKASTGQLENVSSIWKARKNLARVKTLETLKANRK